MGTFTDKQPGQPLNNDENNKNAETNSTPDSQIPVSTKNLTINVFFDGTGNNMFNTDLRLKETPSKDEKRLQEKLEDATSFGNYYTNVALLYMASTTQQNVIENIYVEGSGTVKHQKDQVSGLGFAQGESGLYSRVSEAFEKIQKRIQICGATQITLNVFGFSRGAFYARFFCAMAKASDEEVARGRSIAEYFKKNDSLYDGKQKDEYYYDKVVGNIGESGRLKLSLQNRDISICLVGIYDTVSSHGLFHENDVKPFKLNIGKKQEIAHVVHLTAQNDYRRHFPLTHINTAMADNIGFECSFPGAHSDIGGSYNKDYLQDKYISSMDDSWSRSKGEIDWRWFREMGYYQGDPTSKNRKDWGDFRVLDIPATMDNPFPILDVYANYKVPNNNYQFISANVMKKVAEDAASMTFNGFKKQYLDNDIESIAAHSLLVPINNYACDYV